MIHVHNSSFYAQKINFSMLKNETEKIDDNKEL